MGNTQGLPWNRPLKDSDASAMFHALDVNGADRLNLKDLMAAAEAGIMMPHSLPALYFFDEQKDGTLTHSEFVSLFHFCHSEKRKIEEALSTDKALRDLILRASRAGVKDCSVHGRSSFRRFSSYSNVRKVFSSKDLCDHPSDSAKPSRRSSAPVPPHPNSSSPAMFAQNCTPIVSPAESSDDGPVQLTHAATAPLPPTANPTEPAESNIGSSDSAISSDADEARQESIHEMNNVQHHKVAMYGSQREFDANASASDSDDDNSSNIDLTDPENRTALDVAVLENIMHANIHKLADLLHTEGSRERFMAWLWELADFNSSGVVTLEELRVFLSALSQDGIDLEELVFYKEVGVPLEECIINEFDTTHAGLLSRDEFMVLADLVTREYEFWENRHLERIGDYELGRTIGRGSSGVVRLAMQVESREKVAIKIIKKGKCADLSRLDREIQSLMAAKHVNIVALREVLDSEANLFIVMELCGGGSLVDIVRLYPEERMPEETARFFMRQVFEALAFCHRNGICHRDVRLDNLMLDNNGNVKITDFGHSGIYTPGWDLFSTSLVGSLYNLSPEQILGQLYSGEKIDVWSAGVAVYCLLVGTPPFYEPEVTPLLERITACDFEVPDYLSLEAKDLIQCMIRAVPAERITIQQMLNHPWFFAGPEYGPSMDVVVIPVDAFFKKRPDIAEMIMAITIYQHNLHFHLADTQNPKSSPEDQRGQNWTLKCLCPKNDIKFTVSLFTRESYQGKKQAAPSQNVPGSSVVPTVLESVIDKEAVKAQSGSTSQAESTKLHPSNSAEALSLQNELPATASDVQSRPRGLSASRKERASRPSKDGEPNSARPPLQKRLVKITPLDIAAHIRETNPRGSNDSMMFDFESDRNSRDFSVGSSRDDIFVSPNRSDGSNSVGRRRRGRPPRSQSLDDSGFTRLNRSATIDAFPYQKVYPQREMPDVAKNWSYDHHDGMLSPDSNDLRSGDGGPFDVMRRQRSGANPHGFQRSVTLHAVSSFRAEVMELPLAPTNMDENIEQELHRHPCKTVSPQSPQSQRSPSQEQVAENATNLTLTSSGAALPEEYQVISEAADKIRKLLSSNNHQKNMPPPSSDSSFQPYIEVRLQDGESGVFLKICRKLKNICATKLAAAAERQKRKVGGRRSWSTLRRTASAKGMEPEAPSEISDATV